MPIVIPDTRMSYSAMENGQYLGAGGLVPLWPQVAEAWVIIAAKSDRKKVVIGRLVLKLISKIIEKNNIIRVQATIHSKNITAIRFIEWLGFSLEGEFKNYGPDLAIYYHYTRQSK